MEELNIGHDELTVKIEDLSAAAPDAVAKKIAEILDVKKARDIKVLFVEKQTVIADYFVLCTATSSTQVRSLADEVDYRMTLCGKPPAHTDGIGGDKWTVLDFSSVIVHIFVREAREFYNLDRLWEETHPVETEEI